MMRAPGCTYLELPKLLVAHGFGADERIVSRKVKILCIRKLTPSFSASEE